MSDQFPGEADADAAVASLRNHTENRCLRQSTAGWVLWIAGSQPHTWAALWANELPEAGWEAN